MANIITTTMSDSSGWSVSVTEDRTGVPRGTVGAITSYDISNNSVSTTITVYAMYKGTLLTLVAPPGTQKSHVFNPPTTPGDVAYWGVQ